jgi:3-dehydrosphinganine reductase
VSPALAAQHAFVFTGGTAYVLALMFEGKRVVITGGSSGAGQEFARRLLARGAQVTLLARDRKKLDAARAELSAQGAPERVAIMACDVASAGQVADAFAVLARDGVDVLINSAGILSEGAFDEQPLERYRQIMDTNFFGTLHCVRAAAASLRQRRGRIVNIASLAGLLGVYGYAPYCASKHALVGLSETLRIELRPDGVAVHLVCPPEFESPMVTDIETYRSAVNRAMARSIGVMSATAVVDEALAGIEREQFLIVPGRTARTVTRLARLFPGLARRSVDARLARLRRS